MNSNRVQISVRGVYYETLESTLRRFPTTLLGSRSKRQALPTTNADMIVLHCSAISFDAILFYYQSNGILTRPPSLPAADFEETCRYFDIPEKDIRKMKEREGLVLEDVTPIYEFTCNTQEVIWQFLENPQSSKQAAVYATVVYILIFVSVLLGCFQTLPHLSYKSELFSIDFFLNVFFLVELLLKFFVAPVKFRFFVSTINLIDIISVLPYIVVQFLADHSSMTFLQTVRAFRVLRLLRVRRQSQRLQVVFRILSDCLVDVITMVLAVAMSSLAYASLVYYAEQSVSVDTPFKSIPDSVWWAIQTIIPLGYGDIVPRTPPGKFAAGMVCVLAAFSFTVPVLFLGGKFLSLYSRSFGMTLGNDFKGIDSEQQ